ncbi:MAG: trehalose-phosphatase [Deltaproteobacteria bacterium]|nr:trehalose-phosphatase [Deltaproteobacteria bacterium]
MADRLAPQLDHLASNIRSAAKVLLFTDFDGTLVAIKDRPSECFLDPAVGQTLSALAGQDRIAVGIVSGREIEDLRTRVGVDGIAYAGNHGLEIEGPGFAFREPNAVSLIKELQGMVSSLSQIIAGFPGAWVQDKGLSASVHYRQMNPADIPRLLDVVHNVAKPLMNTQKVVLRNGKMVLEIRPAVDWHKGKTVGWLAKKMSPNCSEPLLIYLGDDDTDEDVFAAWPGGITVCVGKNRNTLANYSVNDPNEVHAFLRWLLIQTQG